MNTIVSQVKGYRSFAISSWACGVVSVALLPVALAALTGRSFSLPRAIYDLAFALGLGTYIVWRVCLWRASSDGGVGMTWPLGLAPYLVLVEGGTSGFVGFSSNWRYVPLVVAVWGGSRLVRFFLVLMYLLPKRRQG